MGEITIEIPQSNAAKSAEDTLVEFVLNELEKKDSIQIIQRTEGCCAGNWAPSLGSDRGWFKCSFDAVDNVIRAFKQKGYIIRDVGPGRYPTRYITFIKK